MNEVRRNQQHAADGKHVGSRRFVVRNVDDLEIAKLIRVDPLAIGENRVAAGPTSSALEMQTAADFRWYYTIAEGFDKIR